MATRGKIVKGLAALVLGAGAVGVGAAADTETGRQVMQYVMDDYALHIAKYASEIKLIGLTGCAAAVAGTLYNLAKGNEQRS